MTPFERLGQIGRFVLPREDGRALRFLASHLFVPHNRRDWIWSRVARGVFGPLQWNLASPLGLSAAGAADLIREVLDWARSQLSRERDSGWSFILYRDRAPLDSARLLLFHGREREPVAVVKLARQGIRSEWEALRALATALAPELAATVPLPAVYRWFEGIEALLMRSLPGRSLSYEVGSRPASARRVEHHLSNGATWLACFHLVTRDRSGRFCAVDEASRATTELPGWFDVAELDPLLTAKLEIPLSARHGAFQPQNLLVRARRGFAGGRGSMTEISGVLDWERFSRSAPPFEDLFHFALTYALDYSWSSFETKPPEEAFRRGFLSETAVSRGIRSALRGYCDLTGLPFEKLRPLFQLFLLERSREEASPSVPWSTLHRLLAERRRTVFDL